MDKINIGSDIKLTVRLNTSYLAPLNIHSVQAYLINTSVKSDLEGQIKAAYDEYNLAMAEKADKIRYISRFPMEPYFKDYMSNCYNIGQCGHPHYYARHCHCVPMYCGFCAYPHTFDGFRNHLWAHYDMDPLRQKIKRAEDLYHRTEQFLQYRALVEQTADPAIINVYFPGSDQIKTGVYKLLLVVKVYQPGYSNFTDFKTITISYDGVFELVTEGGGDTNITIGVVPTEGYTGGGQYGTSGDKYVVQGDYNGSGYIQLTLNDGSQLRSPIDVTSETEWHDVWN